MARDAVPVGLAHRRAAKQLADAGLDLAQAYKDATPADECCTWRTGIT
ncbi:hypothetical protein NB693_26045 [Pantoea ananatis]|nr:hypothetical protein [Pantoea ananatis]